MVCPGTASLAAVAPLGERGPRPDEKPRWGPADANGRRCADAHRASAAWAAWAAVATRLGAAVAPLLRLRPEGVKEAIMQVVSYGPEVSSPGRGANLMPSHEEEAAAYAATDPYRTAS